MTDIGTCRECGVESFPFDAVILCEYCQTPDDYHCHHCTIKCDGECERSCCVRCIQVVQGLQCCPDCTRKVIELDFECGHKELTFQETELTLCSTCKQVAESMRYLETMQECNRNVADDLALIQSVLTSLKTSSAKFLLENLIRDLSKMFVHRASSDSSDDGGNKTSPQEQLHKKVRSDKR